MGDGLCHCKKLYTRILYRCEPATHCAIVRIGVDWPLRKPRAGGHNPSTGTRGNRCSDHHVHVQYRVHAGGIHSRCLYMGGRCQCLVVYEHPHNPAPNDNHGNVLIDERMVAMPVPTVKRTEFWSNIIEHGISRKHTGWELQVDHRVRWYHIPLVRDVQFGVWI